MRKEKDQIVPGYAQKRIGAANAIGYIIFALGLLFLYTSTK